MDLIEPYDAFHSLSQPYMSWTNEAIAKEADKQVGDDDGLMDQAALRYLLPCFLPPSSPSPQQLPTGQDVVPLRSWPRYDMALYCQDPAIAVR